MNTFAMFPKSPARRSMRKSDYYTANVRNFTGWTLVHGENVSDVLSDTETRLQALPNRMTFTPNPDAITDALSSLSYACDYNAPDNY